jgi:hypothetical protein
MWIIKKMGMRGHFFFFSLFREKGSFSLSFTLNPFRLNYGSLFLGYGLLYALFMGGILISFFFLPAGLSSSSTPILSPFCEDLFLLFLSLGSLSASSS